MGNRRIRSVTGGLALLGLLVTACGDDTAPATADTASSDPAGDDAGPQADTGEDDLGDAAASDGGDETAASEEDTGTGQPAAGTAVVTVGDERYETDDLQCPDSVSGTEFFGTAEGPRDNARIHGRFGSSLPELIAVSFARGDEGEWAAVAPNEVLDRGVLEDYTFDEGALTFSGNATFIWVEGAGLQDPDSLTEGSFEVRCG